MQGLDLAVKPLSKEHDLFGMRLTNTYDLMITHCLLIQLPTHPIANYITVISNTGLMIRQSCSRINRHQHVHAIVNDVYNTDAFHISPFPTTPTVQDTIPLLGMCQHFEMT